MSTDGYAESAGSSSGGAGGTPVLPVLAALQISLDYARLDEALPAAAAAIENGIDWIEVGTPLVTCEGLRSVELLRALYPKTTIVVDLKSMDVGGGAAARVADAGGSFVVVMGLSSLKTVEAAVKVGHERGVLVMVDLMGISDKLEAGRRFASMGCDVLVAHTGVDERRGTRSRTVDDAVELGRSLPIAVQAVGGLTLEDLDVLEREGVALAVVGNPLIKYDRESLAGVGAVVREAASRFGSRAGATSA